MSFVNRFTHKELKVLNTKLKKHKKFACIEEVENLNFD